MTENFIYYPPIIKAKELIDAGAIGEPTLVRMHTTKVHQVTDLQMKYDPTAVLWRTNSELTPAGMFWEDGVHKYATAMYWVGEIGPLSAIIGKTEDPTLDLPSAAMWRFKDRDCLGIFDYTLAAEMTMRARFARVDDFFEIHGSKGIIWVTRCSGEMLDMAPVILHQGTESTNYQVPMDWLLSFDGAAKDFVDGLIEGRQPQLDAKAARHVLQASFAAYESARQGRPVDPAELS